MRRILESSHWWTLSFMFSALAMFTHCYPALQGGQSGPVEKEHHGSKGGRVRERRAAGGDSYWAYSGTHGTGGWASSYPECVERNQSPVDISDEDAQVSQEYQELTLNGFNAESSNKTSMKNTGKTVAVLLKDDYFVRGAGLPGRFKAEKIEFHWGQSNGSAGSEHSINDRKFPVEVGRRDNPSVEPIIQGLKRVVHHEKETFLSPFILRDLLPSSLGSYYRYTGSLTSPPCSKVVEWIVFSRPVLLSHSQLEAFYSIFTTEQQDHVKSVEYLRNNYRPLQDLDNREVSKSAVKDAWQRDLTDSLGLGTDVITDASRVCSSAPVNMKIQPLNGTALLVSWQRPLVVYHPPITSFMVSYSWMKSDVAYEKTGDQNMKAVITHVSPDILYLFRVQAVCQRDLRSDFSQTLLFRANTTRIFEGTRIVKTGMPTVSPASSADMAPISSGSSTWTSSGLPFSFVSMATGGIGPSSSGSQATVASVVTSTLLAGLGFSGGVISSLPGSLWPTQAPAASPGSNPGPGPIPSRQPTQSQASTELPTARQGGSDTDTPTAEEEAGVDREAEGEEGEGEKDEGEDDRRKKNNKTVPDEVETKMNSTVVKVPSSYVPTPTAKEKGQGQGEPVANSTTVPPSVGEDQLFRVDSSSGPTVQPKKDTAEREMQIPQSPTRSPKNGGEKSLWPFSVHTDRTSVSNMTRSSHPGGGRMEWIVPLVVVSALTLLCLVMLLAVLVYWRYYR
nr:receptor-type tyrosine-protein phosphatase gamma-like [Oncorhynchus nerka]